MEEAEGEAAAEEADNVAPAAYRAGVSIKHHSTRADAAPTARARCRWRRSRALRDGRRRGCNAEQWRRPSRR